MATAAWLGLLLAVAAASLRGGDTFQLGAGIDDAKYVALARSITSEERYGLVIGPAPARPTSYPFGFPLALAPIVAAFPETPETARWLSLAATLMNVSLLFWGWRIVGRGSPWWGLAAAAGYGLSPLALGFSHMVASEPFFTTLALSALLAAESLAARQRPPLGALIALGGVLALAVFTRTLGVALAAAVGVRLVLAAAAARRTLLALTVGATLLIGTVVACTPVRLVDLWPGRYSTLLVDPALRRFPPQDVALGSRVARGLRQYGGDLLRAAVVGHGGGAREDAVGRRLGIPSLSRWSSWTVTLLVVAGAVVRTTPQLATSLRLFALFHLAILLVWPYRDARLLYAIQPILVIHLLGGLAWVANGLSGIARRPGTARAGPVAAALVAALLAAGGAAKRIADPPDPSTLHTRDLRAGAVWLRAHAPQDAVVLSDYAESTALYSRRPSVPIMKEMSAAEMRQRIRSFGVDYVLIGTALQWHALKTPGYDRVSAQAARALDELERLGEVELVHTEPADLVRVYEVVDGPHRAAGDR